MSVDYKQSGVDIEAGYKAVSLMKKHIQTTYRKEVLTDIGGFGGLFSLAQHTMKHPVLVSGTDGVGTKLKMAFLMDKHDTIGIDCVAMCVNDIICSGADPLFFLDYLACGKNIPERIATIVSGIANGCRQAGAALIGGETAEMPGFYPEDEYDLAGFAVGIVDKDHIIDGSTIKAGDVLLGIASSGIHSNGYSLVRKLFNPTKENLNQYDKDLQASLGDVLITPTKIYVSCIQKLKKQITIKGIGHITGGGFIENIPRVLPKGNKALIHKGAWEIPSIFNKIMDCGVEEEVMYNTFNMGIGMVLVISKEDAEEALQILESTGEKAYLLGEVITGQDGVTLC